MIMILAEKVSKILRYFNFILKIIDLCRCCKTIWTGTEWKLHCETSCEFPLEAAKPKPKKRILSPIALWPQHIESDTFSSQKGKPNGS